MTEFRNECQTILLPVFRGSRKTGRRIVANGFTMPALIREKDFSILPRKILFLGWPILSVITLPCADNSRTLKPKNYGDVASDIIQSGLEAALESGLDDDLKSRAHLERANDIADLSKWIQKIRDINSRNAKAS